MSRSLFPLCASTEFRSPPKKKRKPDRRLGGNRSFVRHKRMLAGLIYPLFVMLHFLTFIVSYIPTDV